MCKISTTEMNNTAAADDDLKKTTLPFTQAIRRAWPMFCNTHSIYMICLTYNNTKSLSAAFLNVIWL